MNYECQGCVFQWQEILSCLDTLEEVKCIRHTISGLKEKW